MTDDALFDVSDPQPEVERSARVSDDGRYRYVLGRTWSEEPPATFIMLNPSTADATVDDPTIRRCVGFARSLGCGGLLVVNLYAFRATKPADLWLADDPVGPDNDEYLRRNIRAAVGGGRPLIAAWGANARDDRVRKVLAMPGALNMTALGVTKHGAPRHPLYLPGTATPNPWLPAA